jgi:hypothetical protein
MDETRAEPAMMSVDDVSLRLEALRLAVAKCGFSLFRPTGISIAYDAKVFLKFLTGN